MSRVGLGRVAAIALIAVAALGCVAPQASLIPSQVVPTASPATPFATASVAAATAAPIPSPTLAASPSSPVSLASPDPRHADPDLEAVLPARIGDAQLTRFSVAGSSFSGGGDVCSFVCPEEPRLMAESVGATRDDLTVAVAYEEVDGRLGRYVIVAFRVQGVTGAQLRAGRISMYQPDPPYPIVGDEQIAGRTVTVAITWWAPNNTEYMVVTDDALIQIRAPSPEDTTGETSVPELVTTIVKALP